MDQLEMRVAELERRLGLPMTAARYAEIRAEVAAEWGRPAPGEVTAVQSSDRFASASSTVPSRDRRSHAASFVRATRDTIVRAIGAIGVGAASAVNSVRDGAAKESSTTPFFAPTETTSSEKSGGGTSPTIGGFDDISGPSRFGPTQSQGESPSVGKPWLCG
jgi:hypothetical protein